VLLACLTPHKDAYACNTNQSVSFADIRNASGWEGWCAPGNPYNTWQWFSDPENWEGTGTLNRGTLNQGYSIDWDNPLASTIGGHDEFDLSINMDGASADEYGYGTALVEDVIALNDVVSTANATWTRLPERNVGGEVLQGKTHTQNIIWLTKVARELNNSPSGKQCLDNNNRTTIDITHRDADKTDQTRCV